MAIFYRIVQAIVAAALAVLIWFFIVGLGDGSIDGSNMALWVVLLAAPIAALVIGRHLWKAGQRTAACVLLAVPAVPTLLFGMLLLLFLILQPDMR